MFWSGVLKKSSDLEVGSGDWGKNEEGSVPRY